MVARLTLFAAVVLIALCSGWAVQPREEKAVVVKRQLSGVTNIVCGLLPIVTQLLTALLSLVTALVSLLATVLSAVTGLLGNAVPGLSSALSAATAPVTSLVSSLPLVGPLADTVTGAVGTLANTTLAAVQQAQNQVAALQANKTALLINQQINIARAALVVSQQQLTDALSNTSNLTAAQFQAAVAEALNRINVSRTLLTQLQSGGPAAVSLDNVDAATASYAALLNTATENALNTNTAALTAAQTQLQNAQATVNDAVTKVQDTVKGALDTAQDGVTKTVSSVTDALAGALNCPTTSTVTNSTSA